MSGVEGAPSVTVVVPAFQEAASIETCLAAVAAQDHPHDDIEVVVVDGESTDGTAEVARRALEGSAFARAVVLSNPGSTTPSNLNRGLAEARGRIVCRIDARSIVPTDYVRRCLDELDARPDVVVVGGAQVAQARGDGAVAVGIARALNNRWATGLSKYRRQGASGPSDTVYLGAFRTDQLRAVGGWDESLGTNQDFDLNRRMGRTGTVWFMGGVSVGYLPRSDLGALHRQYRRFGAAKVAYWRHSGDRPRPRQLAALAVGPAAAAGVAVLARLRPAQAATLASAALATAFVVEGRGCAGPAGSAPARAASLAATACVWSGWTLGSWSALITRPPIALAAPSGTASEEPR